VTAEPTADASGRLARRGGATLAIALGSAMAVTALPLCLLLVAGLLPTFVAALVDRHRARYLARAVAATNLAGVVLPALELLRVGISLAGVAHVLGDPVMWLVMYGAAGVGWVLKLGMPPLCRVVIDIRADQLQQRLEQRAAELVKEWGEEVAGERGAQPARGPDQPSRQSRP
jgi:hypothetical protein